LADGRKLLARSDRPGIQAWTDRSSFPEGTSGERGGTAPTLRVSDDPLGGSKTLRRQGGLCKRTHNQEHAKLTKEDQTCSTMYPFREKIVYEGERKWYTR
jgi:hypothetical protein